MGIEKDFIMDIADEKLIFMHSSLDDFNNIIKNNICASNEVFESFEKLAKKELVLKNKIHEDEYEIGNVKYTDNIITAEFVKKTKVLKLPRFKRKIKMFSRNFKR